MDQPTQNYSALEPVWNAEDKLAELTRLSKAHLQESAIAKLLEEAWPEPEPLGGKLPPVEPMLPEMLPPALRPWIEDIATRLQVPLDFPAVAAIAALAGVTGRRACIHPKELDSWTETPNLWGGIVAAPGSKKSPVISAVLDIVKKVQEEWIKEDEALKIQHRYAVEEAAIAKANWTEKAKGLMKNGKPAPERPTEPPPAPPERRLVTQDATLQCLHQILAANPGGIFVVRDELTGWFAQLEKQGREQERGFYLEGWNGNSSYTIDTLGRGRVHVPNVCLALFGGIQPSRLRLHLADALKGGPTNDGLMQRFQLLVWPDPLTGLRTYVDRQPDEPAKRQAEAIYRRVALMDAETPVVFRFDAEGQDSLNSGCRTWRIAV